MYDKIGTQRFGKQFDIAYNDSFFVNFQGNISILFFLT